MQTKLTQLDSPDRERLKLSPLRPLLRHILYSSGLLPKTANLLLHNGPRECWNSSDVQFVGIAELAKSIAFRPIALIPQTPERSARLRQEP